MSETAPSHPLLAAVLYGTDSEVEDLLADAAADLRARGLNIAGMVQRTRRGESGCAGPMDLINVATGEAIRISQDLGAASRSCRVDPSGLAEASVILRDAITRRVDLVIVNKFGGLERQGRGLASDILAAVTEGVPVLTSVSRHHLDRWDEFTGGYHVLLPPDRAAILEWGESLRNHEAATP